LSISFWFDSERLWDVKHYSKEFFKQFSNFDAEILSQKRTLGPRNLRFFQEKKSAQSQWVFVLVFLYSRVYVGKG